MELSDDELQLLLDALTLLRGRRRVNIYDAKQPENRLLAKLWASKHGDPTETVTGGG